MARQADSAVRLLLILHTLSIAKPGLAQTSPQRLGPILSEQVQPRVIPEYELRHHLMGRIPKLPSPTRAEEWAAEEKRIRHHLLDDVVFHGWPRDWVESPPRFVDLGLIESGHGYALRKLRYVIVPGFQSTALLYEPEPLTGRVPAILSVNGSFSAISMASDIVLARDVRAGQPG